MSKMRLLILFVMWLIISEAWDSHKSALGTESAEAQTARRWPFGCRWGCYIMRHTTHCRDLVELMEISESSGANEP